jgi:large subunit ribosomal protein L17
MLSNMAASLIVHKRIKTTTAKAKALKIYIEPLITKAKEDTTHSRRQVFSYLQDKDATSELFRDVAEKVADRPGGYTRIIKLGNRLGDNADICIIELVDYNETMLAEKAAATKSSRRRRGGKKKSQDAQATTKSVEQPAAPVTDDDVAAEDVKGEEAATVVEEEQMEVGSEASADAPDVEDKPEDEPKKDTPAEEPVKDESTENPDEKKEEGTSDENEKKE